MATNPKPNASFRPDPGRGVFLSQDIDQAALDRLTPIVLQLQSESRGPISLFIDSIGGSTYSSTVLNRLLRSTDQDGSTPCRLITVATGVAASAAADLLMGGDYAIAYPHARIMCHGVSQRGKDEALTHEKASQLAKSLASSNERFAIQLADNCISRFIFRIAMLSHEFSDVRERFGNPLLREASCFIEALRARVSPVLVGVLEQALKQSSDNDALDLAVSDALSAHDIGAMPRPQFEVALLKSIIDYEAGQHSDDPQWSFRGKGLEVISDKWELLFDKYTDHHSEMTSLLCDRWGSFFIPEDAQGEIELLPEEDRAIKVLEIASNTIRPLWFFFVSICRVLQKDDYWMTAEEAYWLGLIDEIIGRSDLPCPRVVVECAPGEDDKDLTDASAASGAGSF